MSIPVQIISGFLGTGKTTAIQAQLGARQNERVAVIVNDFGEAGLDEAILANADPSGEPFQLMNIPGGCVCCTAPEGFVSALGAVIEQAPERIWIEPTGLARPQDLVDTIRRGPHRDALHVAPVVVLVDPARLAVATGEERSLIEEQSEAADVLVANRTDLCRAEDLEAFDAWAEALWPEPLAVVRTTHGVIPSEALDVPDDAARRSDTRAGGAAAHGHAHSTEGYSARSWLWPAEQLFERARLLSALEEAAAAGLVRFKGVLRTREGVLQLDWVGGTLHERASAHRRDSRADAIASQRGGAALDRLSAALKAAVLTEAEQRAQANQIELVLPAGRVELLDRDRLMSLPDAVEDVSALVPKRSGRAARIRALWADLGAPEGGHAVVCAADGFASEPVPIGALREGLLLHTEAGEPLSDKKGGPFRLLIPEGVPGAPSACANVKAVTRIVVRED